MNQDTSNITKKPFYKTKWFWIIAGVVLLVIIVDTGDKNKPSTQTSEQSAVKQVNTTPSPATQQSNTVNKEKAQQELGDLMATSKKAGLVESYEFSEKASVVFVGKVWYTQTVSFKKDFLAKIAMLKKDITGFQHFEVRDAYSNEKVAEVTSFSGSLEVYK